MKADLHVHTTASDGRLSPTQIVHLAVEKGLDTIAITDHDSVDGVEEAIMTSQKFPSFMVIPGVELSTDVDNGEVHILGYLMKYKSRNFISALYSLRNGRQLRARRMVEKLHDLGIKLDYSRIEAMAQGGTICRPHIARAMHEKEYVKTEREAFDKYIGNQGPAYVLRQKLLPVEAVRLIAKAGGFPVLAHPCTIDNLDILLDELQEAGLVGLEAVYGEYDEATRTRLLRIAGERNLIPTGGTDYHAFGNKIEPVLGSTLAPPESVRKLIELDGKKKNPRQAKI